MEERGVILFVEDDWFFEDPLLLSSSLLDGPFWQLKAAERPASTAEAI